mmetsp:Transcript_2771/g.8937  ORF Transcript_2771/g.8937 Transcript_2771/m.8937 type:complete len:212 (+) Transcript_2771:1028-1663(+)
MTNCPNRAERLYELRPCHRSRRDRKENCRMEKSDASDACFPSLPTMPKPTSAAWIMATSLPPSPIAAICLPVAARRSITTSAFWVGEHRQHTTAGAWTAHNANSSRIESRMICSVAPSTMMGGMSSGLLRSSCDMEARTPAAVGADSECKVDSDVTRRAEAAMHRAVSSLSPVSIHTRMPALRSVSNVPRTLCCSRSSTPVTASSSRSHSR